VNRPIPTDKAPIVYVIRSVNGGPVKVGRTTLGRLGARLAEIQTGHPERLHIVTTLHGGAECETTLHAALEDWRIHGGEWFDADALSFIVEYQRVAQGGEDARVSPLQLAGDPRRAFGVAALIRKVGLNRMRKGRALVAEGHRLIALAEQIEKQFPAEAA